MANRGGTSTNYCDECFLTGGCQLSCVRFEMKEKERERAAGSGRRFRSPAPLMERHAVTSPLAVSFSTEKTRDKNRLRRGPALVIASLL